MEIKVSKINGKDVSRYKRAKKESDTNIKTFFYDESFEDYNDALYNGKTLTENGIEQKELSMEIEFHFSENDDIPFYEKMLEELMKSSTNLKIELKDKSDEFPIG